MTTIVTSFYSDDVFDRPGDFFEEGSARASVRPAASSSAPRPKRGGSWSITKFSGRFLRTTAAVLSINVFTVSPMVASVSKQPIERPARFCADAAVSPPRLTSEQARSARLMKAAFVKLALEHEEDLKGPDPDYGF